MGSFMSGGLAWAMVEPSVKVTIECTIDCGCTTTSMRSYGMPNSRWVSISSSPLLTSDAEFSVFIGPIDQVGCAPACSGVTSSSSVRRPTRGTARPTRSARSWPPRRECRRAGTAPSRSVRSRRARSGRARRPSAPADHRRPATPCWPAPAGRRMASAASVGRSPSAPDQRVEHDVGLGVLDEPGGGVGPGIGDVADRRRPPHRQRRRCWSRRSRRAAASQQCRGCRRPRPARRPRSGPGWRR